MSLLISLAVLQVGLPAALFAWLWFARPPTRLDWLARIALTAAVTVISAVAGLWLFPPVIASYVLLGTVPVLAYRSWSRVVSARWSVPAGAFAKVRLVGVSVGVVLALQYTVGMLRAWTPPANSAVVDLQFPLRAGTYYVANGGNDVMLNAHLKTLDPQFLAYRGQSYAVDIQKLGPGLERARGILPSDPASYAIFGEPVYAPCAGTVVIAVDGNVDLMVPNVDRDHMAGNHVILRCGAYEVLLGHLKHGSVAVAQGDVVTVSDHIGNVGNSGNTTEPHLHVHVQTPAPAGVPIGGSPVAVTFSGDYLVRNELVRAGS